MSTFSTRNNRAAKLSPTQVQEIREFYKRGAVSQGQLARDYQVSIGQIGRIVRGEVWQSLRPSEPSREELDASARRMLALQEVRDSGGSGMAKLQQHIAKVHQTVDSTLADLQIPPNPMEEGDE